MINGYKECTRSGNVKRVSYEEIFQWITAAWNEVPVDTIRNGFIKTTLDFYNKGENVAEPQNGESDEEADIPIVEHVIREKLMNCFLDKDNCASDEKDFGE